MSEHPSPTQIEDYSRRKLPAEELISVADHMAMCEECRLRAERALNGDAAFFALRTETVGEAEEARISTAGAWHLTFDQTADYVDATLMGEELQVVKDHLNCCEACAAFVADLRGFKREVAAELNREYQPASTLPKAETWIRRLLRPVSYLPQRSNAFIFGAALATLLLAAGVWLVWQALQGKATDGPLVVTVASPTVAPRTSPTPGASIDPVVSPEIPNTAIVAKLKDGPGEVTLGEDGKLSGVENLPPAYQRLVQDALTRKRFEKSPLLGGLIRPGSSLMSGGDNQPLQFSVIEPVGKVTSTDRPTFRWSRLEGATGYVVEIYDENFKLAATSPNISDTSWMASPSLARGNIYSWQVKAIKDKQEIISPRPPAPQAKFRILDQARMNELAAARRAYASSHLALAMLFAQAGLLDEAEQELRALQKANPNSTVVRQLLSHARSLRR